MVVPMDELEAIFDKLRKCMAGRVSESILIEVDVVEIRMQQLLLRERARGSERRGAVLSAAPEVAQCVDAAFERVLQSALKEELRALDEQEARLAPQKWKN
jgi:hypothetical protein